MRPPVEQPRLRREIPGMVAAVSALVLVASVAASCAETEGMPVARDSASAGTSDPRAIAGGRFESSGVAHVPGSNQLLFVDDGRPREVFLMELTGDGSQKGSAVSVPLGADVTDLEGITSDGQFFYVVGSQSKKTGFDGDGLVRFRYEPTTRRVDRVERVRGLKAWLAANVAELRGTERRIGDDVLNIEGLAWDSAGRRLLLGLRAPVIDGHALIVAVKLSDPAGLFAAENLRVDGSTIRVDLDGAGIRSLEHDGHANTFRIIAGAGINDEGREFRLVEWDGKAGSKVQDISAFDRRLKPEGITRAVLDGKSVSVLVFDVGRFDVLK